MRAQPTDAVVTLVPVDERYAKFTNEDALRKIVYWKHTMAPSKLQTEQNICDGIMHNRTM